MEAKDTKKKDSMMLRTLVDRNVGDLYVRYAAEHFDGNVSAAMRHLLAQGYAMQSTADSIEKVFDERVETATASMEERLAKVTSRGTKASLGNLALNSETLVAICNILRSIDRDNHTIMRAMHLKVDEDSEGAFDRIHDLMARHPAVVFDWAWDAGGRMQAQKGSVDVLEATRNLKYRYPEQKEE